MEKPYHLLYPMRVVLVSARYEGKESIMPAAWCFPLSSDPPMFGVAIAKKRFTYSLIHKSKAFAINLASPDMQEGVLLCGSKSGRDSDKFAATGWKREEGKKTVLVGEAPASIECEVEKEIEAGDHVVFVGKAINVVKRGDAKGIYQSGGTEFIGL
ncbi:flavin reductase family protein [Candidatus Micrarchaeota archaeon]|nr:flavin reductase family protein [Candidatus Micrarchaeota archaeon]